MARSRLRRGGTSKVLWVCSTTTTGVGARESIRARMAARPGPRAMSEQHIESEVAEPSGQPPDGGGCPLIMTDAEVPTSTPSGTARRRLVLTDGTDEDDLRALVHHLLRHGEHQPGHGAIVEHVDEALPTRHGTPVVPEPGISPRAPAGGRPRANERTRRHRHAIPWSPGTGPA